jgi:hypothetical protein
MRLNKLNTTDFLEDMIIVSGFNFLLLEFIGVCVHGIAYKQEIEMIFDF